MPTSDHAISGSDGGYCCRCASAVGPAAKSQPTTCDGETYCPRCFVWSRMSAEADRFNASQTAAVKCQFCAWTTVCFGARPGMGLICSHCRRGGAQRIRIELDEAQAKALRQAIE